MKIYYIIARKSRHIPHSVVDDGITSHSEATGVARGYSDNGWYDVEIKFYLE